jgi:hypothetical protein
MACVLTVALLENDVAVVGHVGDSRLYKIHRGQIRKMTHDHSPVGEREDKLELTEAEAMRHPRRNEVFRDVGSEEHSPDDPEFIEVVRVPFEPDAALVLCSDGLSDQVPSADILRLVESNAGAPESAASALVDAANRAGGKDNVTVLIVEGEAFVRPEAPAAPSRRGIFRSAPAMLLYGMTLAALLLFAGRRFWVPAPVVSGPRILEAGSGSQYPTISQAIAAANTGDSVVLASGEYLEQVHLKTGVTLRSLVPREAILRASPLNNGPAIVASSVKDARVSGLRIDATPAMPLSAGIVLENSEVQIEDMEIAGAAVGVDVRGASTVSLVGNSIHDCTGEGILITGTSIAWVSHNAIARNKGAGVAARGGVRPTLVGNVLDRNDVELPASDLEAVHARNYFLDLHPPVPARAPRLPAGGRKQ